MLKINRYVVGMIATNCYLIEDEATKKCAVIDPGDESQSLIDEIEQRGTTLDFILLTHGHFDHVLNVAALVDRYHPEVCVCEDEMELLQKGLYNRSSIHHIRLTAFRVDRLLKDGDVIMLGDSKITFLHTPGHTEGSGCYLVDNHLFSGDTVFCESVGRTDFETSSPEKMRHSIEKIKQLDGDYFIYPGHDIPTTLAHERQYNPFFRM